MNLSKFLTNSINWQDTYSGGPSPKDFMMQWGQELSDSERSSCNYIYSYHQAIEPETTYEIKINIAGGTKAALGRYLGCVMIGFMPDEGLEEALFSLRDMLEFYGRKPSIPPARLSSNAIAATIGSKKKRPDLVLSD